MKTKQIDPLMNNAISLTQELIRFPSITPNDAGSFNFVVSILEQLEFTCHEVTQQGIRNLVAVRRFGPGPTLAFAGHLDVVPAGPSAMWICPPFSADIIGEQLYGRGVADMKGAVACFIAAIQNQIKHLDQGALMLLLTCDEEGEAEYGTVALMSYLRDQHPELIPEYCLVGEPSCKHHLGDNIKIGRRGSISGNIKVYGQQGHVAYPQLCDNAAHHAVVLSQCLLALEWDKGSTNMPGTSLQITKLNSGEFVDNVVPGVTEIAFNIRYSSKYCEQSLQQKIQQALIPTGLDFELSWQRPCAPYFNSADKLVATLKSAIDQHLGIRPSLSTDGGTSDGRFIASDKTQVIEFGLKNDSIHQVNESASVSDLAQLARVYQSVIASFCQQQTITSEVNQQSVAKAKLCSS